MNELKPYEKPDETAKQLQQIKEWMLEGQSIVDIVEACHEKGMNSKTIKGLVEKAGEEWQKMGEVGQDQITGFARAGMMHVYKKMVEIGDYANAARTLEKLTKL